MSDDRPPAEGTPEPPGSRSGGDRPYKGLNSFQIEDGHLFYGRDHEADQLIAKILDSRLTILHAQSGAGKTSLLNAKIIPGLEEQGWSAVRVIPQDDPVRSVQTTTLLSVLPPPSAERLSIETAWERLDAPPTLGLLLQRYADLKPDAANRRELIGAVSVETRLPWAEGGDGRVRVYPWFTRLLRGTVDLSEFAEHLSALGTLAGGPQDWTVGPETPIGVIVQKLTALEQAYPVLLERLYSKERELDRFFVQLVDTYGARRADFGLVVLFDQAEELFTRFVDQPHRDRAGLDWRLKWEFFEQLEHLIGPAGTESGISGLPVKLVISLRSEYIGQLDPIRSLAWNIDSCSYHLGMLGKREAKTATTLPADQFGYGYTDECYDTITAELAREDRYVEPAQLQIVCDKLWSVHGRLLAESESARQGGEKPLIGLATLQRLGDTRGILGSFLTEQLGSLPPDDRLEALELLEPLVTVSGTRNVASRDELVRERFRNVDRRRRLLATLVENRIVREELRLGGDFVEITHEFLIDPLLMMLKELSTDSEYSRFRWGLGALQRLAETAQGSRTADVLRIGEFLAVHDNRHRIVMDDWVRHAMLRTAIALAHVIPVYRKPDELVAFWAEEVDLSTAWVPPDLGDLLRVSDVGVRVLQPLELRVVNRNRGSIEPNLRQLRTILRSELTFASDDERPDVEYWTRKVEAHGQPVA